MASGDMREDILARLLAIGAGVSGIEQVARNRGLLTNEKRPAIVVLDGDETPRVSIDTSRIKGNFMLMAPQIVQLRPEIYILPKEKRPVNVDPASSKNIGTEANELRIAYLTALWEDETLAMLLGSNGSIVYNGCETDLKSGSAMSGEIRLDLLINYLLMPS